MARSLWQIGTLAVMVVCLQLIYGVDPDWIQTIAAGCVIGVGAYVLDEIDNYYVGLRRRWDGRR